MSEGKLTTKEEFAALNPDQQFELLSQAEFDAIAFERVAEGRLKEITELKAKIAKINADAEVDARRLEELHQTIMKQRDEVKYWKRLMEAGTTTATTGGAAQ